MITYITVAIALAMTAMLVGFLFLAHHKNWISEKTRNGISWAVGTVGGMCVIATFILQSYGNQATSQPLEAGESAISRLQGTSTSRKSAVTLIEPFLVKTALKLMYGADVIISADDKTDQWYAQWAATPEQAKDLFNDSSVRYVNSRVFMALPYYANDTDNYLVLTTSLPDSGDNPLDSWQCHACAPVIGGAILAARNGAWMLAAKTLDIGKIGQWGKTEQGNLIVIGRDRYAVIFHFTYMAQGNIDKTMMIIGQVGSELKVLLDVPTGSNDTDGTCAMEEDEARRKHRQPNYQQWCYNYVSKYYFVPDRNSSYYDLVMSYAGTNEDDTENATGIKDVSRIDIYRFDGEGYKLSKRISQPPIDPASFNELLY